MGYKSHVFKGVSWMGMLRISSRGISFVRIALLARILTPAQFGVFGIAALVLAFLEVITETGINVFLIQRKDDINKYIDPAWLISIIRGFIVGFLIILTAPLVVKFFNSPESLRVILLISFVPIIRGFINPSIVKIQKDIEFHKEFYVRSILLIVDTAVVVVVALIYRNAESFAVGLIISAILEVILSFVFFKPTPRFSFDREMSLFILRRGMWVTLTGVFSYLADYGDKVVVGRVLGTSALGTYQVAFRISTLPISEIADAVNKVTFPVFSKFSEDKERLIHAFSRVILVSSVAALLSGIFIFIFAEQIVNIVLGDNWTEAIPIVKILAIYGILRTIFGSFTPLFLAIHKQIYVATMTFVRVFALFVVILPLISVYGLIGAGYAAIISVLVEIPIVIILFMKFYFKR